MYSMAREKQPNSKWPFGGLGLDDRDEETLKQYLKDKEMSLAGFKRFLIRKWLETQNAQKHGTYKS